MAGRPNKDTALAWRDRFADLTPDSQARELALLQEIHRQTLRKPAKSEREPELPLGENIGAEGRPNELAS